MLPKFMSFVKYGPEVRIRVSNRPILLRDIIDNRLMMEANGQDIVKKLLKGVLQIQEEGISMRTI
jgi:hypothetical protein